MGVREQRQSVPTLNQGIALKTASSKQLSYMRSLIPFTRRTAERIKRPRCTISRAGSMESEATLSCRAHKDVRGDTCARSCMLTQRRYSKHTVCRQYPCRSLLCPTCSSQSLHLYPGALQLLQVGGSLSILSLLAAYTLLPTTWYLLATSERLTSLHISSNRAKVRDSGGDLYKLSAPEAQQSVHHLHSSPPRKKVPSWQHEGSCCSTQAPVHTAGSCVYSIALSCNKQTIETQERSASLHQSLPFTNDQAGKDYGQANSKQNVQA